jgi:hypothetical protein
LWEAGRLSSGLSDGPSFDREPIAGGRATKVNNSINRRPRPRRAGPLHRITRRRIGKDGSIYLKLAIAGRALLGLGSCWRQEYYVRDVNFTVQPSTNMATNEELSSLHGHPARAANSLNTPPVATPPRTATPPPGAEKRKSERNATEQNGARRDSAAGALKAEAVDPNALSKALLKEFEDAGKHRDITPGGSPSRKRQRVYGDR